MTSCKTTPEGNVNNTEQMRLATSENERHTKIHTQTYPHPPDVLMPAKQTETERTARLLEKAKMKEHGAHIYGYKLFKLRNIDIAFTASSQWYSPKALGGI